MRHYRCTTCGVFSTTDKEQGKDTDELDRLKDVCNEEMKMVAVGVADTGPGLSRELLNIAEAGLFTESCARLPFGCVCFLADLAVSPPEDAEAAETDKAEAEAVADGVAEAAAAHAVPNESQTMPPTPSNKPSSMSSMSKSGAASCKTSSGSSKPLCTQSSSIACR